MPNVNIGEIAWFIVAYWARLDIIYKINLFTGIWCCKLCVVYTEIQTSFLALMMKILMPL